MPGPLISYTRTCACGDTGWNYITVPQGASLTGAVAIEGRITGPEPNSPRATWIASEFPQPLPMCCVCGCSYVHVDIDYWLPPQALSGPDLPYPNGYWYGYTPPPPVTVGSATISSRIRVGSFTPTFAWQVEYDDGLAWFLRAHPDDTEHTALVSLLTTYGPVAAIVLANIATDPTASFDDILTATLDTLR